MNEEKEVYTSTIEKVTCIEPSRLISELLELPDKIKKQQQKLADISQAIEEQKLLIEKIKLDHLDTVLCATENSKPKYTNEQTRKIALEKLLQDDENYYEAMDALLRYERQMNSGKIELDYLNNQFRVYLAIAGMQGMRV